MKLESLGVVFLILNTLMFSGCTSKPIYNFPNMPIATSGKALTDSDISKAIIRAGSSLGWTMQNEAPGHIIGTLNIRKHVAIVDISYNRHSYSIIYKDSTNLGYNGTSIHRNYNTWVNNLNNAIKVQINNKAQLINQ